MTSTSPLIQGNTLTYHQSSQLVQLMVDTSEWYAWLEAASTFTFHSEQGTFTARKERAGSRRGGEYWKAYRRRHGKLYRVYLGKSEELTLEQLKSVAVVLASKGEGDSSLDMPGLRGGTRPSSEASSMTSTHLRRTTGDHSPQEAGLSKPWLAGLPVPLTALIGREQEVWVICDLLRQPEVRLLTITGTGGVGKTRLAFQIAQELLDDFSDGTYFVSLAPLSDPGLVLPTITQTFGLRESADHTPLTLLQAYLRNKHLLFFLDNFEQVVTAAPLLVELLRTCPHLKILVTSRTLLRVSGEHEFPVLPLAVPDLKQLPESESLSHYAAVNLFLQRAQALKPDFQLTSTNARTIAEICVHLDGLPLAIELAAARINLLTPQALLTRLSQRLQVLTSGTRDAPARQQTLRNTMEWSYHLLDASEQRLFRRLSVFVGGCILEAVEALSVELDGEAGPVLDGVASLLDKSLLQQREQGEWEPRLMMLETIREYGLECLTAHGEMETTLQAYTAYYLMIAEQAKPELQGPQQDIWLERLEWEHGNLRKVLGWLLEQEEIEKALRLGVALARFWEVHGHLSEGYQWLDRALSSSQNVAASLRAWGLNEAAWFVCLQGKTDQAERLLSGSLSLFRTLDDKRGSALALRRRGIVARMRGQYGEAGSLALEALLLFKEVSDRGGVAHVLLLQAYLAMDQGEYVKAGLLLEECLSVFVELGDKRRMALVSVYLAHVIFAQGDPASAQTLAEESLALAKSLDDKETMALGLSLCGKIALRQDDVATAGSLFAKSLANARERGHQGHTAEVLSLLARTATFQGDYVTARVLFEESLALCAEVGKEVGKTTFAACLEGLADLFLCQGESVWTIRLWGMSEVCREKTGVPMAPIERPDYEHSVAAARSHLGERAFAATWAEGRRMTLEQVLPAFTALPPPIAAKPVLAPPTMKPVISPDGLTTREVEVLRLVAQGLTDAQVAEKLVISPRTVNSHLKSIYSKIQVSSRSAATVYALAHHLV